MTETAIRIDNLARDFETVRAVDRLTLEVPSGLIFGFLGPNGAGKTTTINLLLGLLEPTHGRAEVLDFDTQTQSDEIRTRTGALLEHPGLYEQLSAEDNLEFYGRIWRLSATERRARIKELLSHMGVWERRKERVGKWSKGMKQKLALARAMLHRPPLIFLDEPTVGLDVAVAEAVRDDLEALVAREGVTVFLTTHNMAEAERLCSQIAVVREGRLVAVGHPNKLREQATNSRLEILGRGFDDNLLNMLQARSDVIKAEVKNEHLTIDLCEDKDAAQLVSLVVSAGVQVEEVHRGKASLEEVYLALMEEKR
jgi:ABC-2 type transport system ATP-binding protein